MKETEKMAKKIEEIQKVLNYLDEQLEGLYLDDDLDECLSEIAKTEEGKKLTKKQRKEMVLDFLKKRYPKLSKQLDEFLLLAEAIYEKVDSARSKIEDAQDEIGEIEYEQQELQDRIDNLRYN